MLTKTNRKITEIVKLVIFWPAWLFGTRLIVPLVPVSGYYMSNIVNGTVGCLTAIVLARLLWSPNKSVHTTDRFKPGSWWLFFPGFLAGVCLLLFIIAALLLCTSLTFSWRPERFDRMAPVALIGLVPLALMEEIVFRRVPLQRLLHPFNPARNGWWIVICTSIAFGLYHVSSLQDFSARFTGPFLWGFVFSIAFIWSKGLAFPTGLHVALNAGQSLLGMKTPNESLFEVIVEADATVATRSIETVGFLTILIPSTFAYLRMLYLFKQWRKHGV